MHDRAARPREAAARGREPAPQGGALALQGERGHRREPLARRGARAPSPTARSTRCAPTSSRPGSTTARAASSSAQRIVEARAPRRSKRNARRSSTRAALVDALRAAIPRSLEQGAQGPALLRRTAPEPPLQSLIAVPLRMKQRLMRLDRASRRFTAGKRFDEGQRKLLTIVGSRAAAAIENARLYEDLQATFQQTIEGLAKAIDKMDRYTVGPLRARRALRDVPRHRGSASRPKRSRSCARAR